MKKSYFAIGAVVAAMCSCSSESIPSAGEGNVLPGTEDLSPISLSLTGTNANVEVGSRTRGTGNVGGADGTTWQHEKLYVLMTSSDTHCLAAADIAAQNPETNSWGFTNLNGSGPWLREQFNGAIWGRVQAGTLVYNSTELSSNNDWYNGAGVDRFYPINGASDFFAYHIDDAATTTSTTPIYAASTGEYLYPEQAIAEAYPSIEKSTVNPEMTVAFTIDGTQDLLAGKAERDGTYTEGFSAKSARHGVVPNIAMKHLLSRLKFIIHRGDYQAKNIQITGVTIKQVRNTGRMIVAYKNAASNASLIQWQDQNDEFDADAIRTETDVLKYKRADFTLKDKAPALVDADDLSEDKQAMATLSPYNVSTITNWYQPLPEDGATGTGDKSAELGGGMFVAPGETKYEMVLSYKVLVKDNDDDGVFDEPTFDPGDGHLTSGDLIETMEVPYPLTAPAGGFQAGYSYNINITVYGLKPITATVTLTPWAEGDGLWIGGDAADDKPENL